jgi:hypothetical protein
VVTPREEVLWFAERMERKLKANDHKGHWDNCEMGYLSRRLHQEAKELSRALRKLADEIEKAAVYAPIVELATIENVIDEAADCANFSMMIADNARAFLREERDR